MNVKNKKGQSTVEYILLVTAVVAAMIVFATNKNGGLQAQLCSTLNTVTGDVGTSEGTLSTSHQAQPSTTNGSIENTYKVDVTQGVGSTQ